MTDQSHLRQSSPLTAIPKVANRPHRTADRMYIAGRRDFVVLLASGVAISAWALFPSTVESGIYVPPPETSTRSVADVKSAREGVTGDEIELSRANAFSLMDAKLVSSKPTMYGLATVRYSSPALNVSLVPLRAKLQALLMLLYSQYGDVDTAFLEAKLNALLRLPDSVLAQLIEHPDLADLNKTLDAVFLGTSDLSGVRTELDKIDVTSVPTPSEKIDVVKVNGKPAYVVHSPAVQMRTENVAASPVSALPAPPSGPVTVVSLVGAPASVIASAFTMAPSSVQLPPPTPPSSPPPPPPAPAALSALAFTVAPSPEQLTPPPPPAPALERTVAPSIEQLAPSAAPTPTSTPTATTPTASVEPTGPAQTAQDIMSSGNKFEPGETATQQNSGHSPPTNSPAPQSATPSPPATGVESPTEPGGGTSGGGTTGGGTTGGGTTGGGTTGGGTSSSNNEGGGPS